MPRIPIPLTGKHFGTLTVIRQVSRNAHGNSRWLCECQCGTKIEAYYQNLTQGRVKSCGASECRKKSKQPKAAKP